MVHILMLEPIPMLVPAPPWSRLQYRLFWSVTNLDSDSGKTWNHITLSPNPLFRSSDRAK